MEIAGRNELALDRQSFSGPLWQRVDASGVRPSGGQQQEGSNGARGLGLRRIPEKTLCSSWLHIFGNDPAARRRLGPTKATIRAEPQRQQFTFVSVKLSLPNRAPSFVLLTSACLTLYLCVPVVFKSVLSRIFCLAAGYTALILLLRPHGVSFVCRAISVGLVVPSVCVALSRVILLW